MDAAGKVTAVKEGTATITAKAGEKTATCAVTVEKKVIAVESVTIDKTTLTLVEGETATLTATVAPENATDKTVTWTSSDAAVATVDAEGKVTAVKEGTATITAKAGEKTATCQVTVNKKVVVVETVTLSLSSAQILVSEILRLTATVKPDNASDKTVTWTSSTPSVATVSDAGVVSGVAPGTTTIKAVSGSASAQCVVTVINFDPGSSEGIGDGGSLGGSTKSNN